MVIEISDWRKSYKEYLEHKVLPPERKEASKLLKHIGKYCTSAADIYRKGYNGKLLRYLGNEEYEGALNEVYQGDCGKHQGGRKLFEELIRIGYYWPTMERDAMDFSRKCKKCQIFGNKIHAPAVPLQSITTP